MIRERLIRLLGGVSAPPATLREAAGLTVDADETAWRPLGGAARDLSPQGRARMQERAAGLWERNMLARQLVELPVAWLLAGGVRLRVADAEAQAWLDAFWRDPITDMRRNLPRMMRELALFGEQCWPVFADPESGHVRLGYLDPARIETVVCDPDNAAQPIGVVTRRDRKGHARRYRTVVAGPESVFAAPARAIRETMQSGEAFFFRRNSLMGAARGRSDLLAATDWLDAYERFLQGEADRADFLRAFVWDVTLAGADADDVARRAREIAAPAPGTVRVHNEAERWTALSPGLGGEDAGATARLLRNHMLSGFGWPEHWFGGGGDVNRATAAEMGEPAFKSLAMRRREWTAILEEVAAYVVRRRLDPSARSADGPDLGADLTPAVEWPETAVRDAARHASALSEVAAAATAAADRGLLREETALKLIRAVAEPLGVAFDPSSELAAAREEAARRSGRGQGGEEEERREAVRNAAPPGNFT